MKKMLIVVLGMVLVLSVTGMVIANDNPSAVAQTPAICPVMGGKSNPNLSTDYNGRQVYFCCPPCREKFKNDPERFLKKPQ